MKCNTGSIDRIARALIGAALIVATLLGYIGVWGWLGIIPLGTAIVGFCPAYTLLGVNTCSVKEKP